VPRQVAVSFYALGPMHPAEGQLSFTAGSYPLDAVQERIRKLDPASEEYRIRENLWGGETLCLLHEDGPQAVLGAYYRDNLAKAFTEYKGEITELALREGEALVDAAFAAFFPNDVVGLVRTSSKSPGFAKIGQWLSCIGGYACGLMALPDPDTLAQLDRSPTTMLRLKLRARRDRLPLIEQHSPSVAKVLRAAAEMNSATDEVGAEWRLTHRKDQAMWSQLVRQQLQELLSVLPEFSEAKVHVSGQRRPINLTRGYVQQTVTVQLEGTKRVGPTEAAVALFEAYDKEQASITKAVGALRRHLGEATPNDG
jgi:hypothetical protein